MKTTTAVVRMLLAGALTLGAPSLALAMPGDAHDDVTYPQYDASASAISGGVAGPKALAFDDAPYPDATPEEREQGGTALAFTGSPEPYGHDDAGYAAPAEAPVQGAVGRAVASAAR